LARRPRDQFMAVNDEAQRRLPSCSRPLAKR
jgi:hypothetical protein